MAQSTICWSDHMAKLNHMEGFNRNKFHDKVLEQTNVNLLHYKPEVVVLLWRSVEALSLAREWSSTDVVAAASAQAYGEAMLTVVRDKVLRAPAGFPKWSTFIANLIS